MSVYILMSGPTCPGLRYTRKKQPIKYLKPTDPLPSLDNTRSLQVGGGYPLTPDQDETDKISQHGNLIPFREQASSLNYQEAIKILRNTEEYNVCSGAAVRPKGGQMFLISSNGDTLKRNDWRCDQYSWEHNGTQKYPGGKGAVPIINKMYHKLTKQGTFARQAWWLLDNPDLVLVHYMGDHNEFKPKAHRNSKHNKQPHVRTCPSVLAEIKEKVHERPISIFKKMVGEESESVHEAVLKPKNKKQVTNTVQCKKKQNRGGEVGLSGVSVSEDILQRALEVVSPSIQSAQNAIPVEYVHAEQAPPVTGGTGSVTVPATTLSGIQVEGTELSARNLSHFVQIQAPGAQTAKLSNGKVMVVQENEGAECQNLVGDNVIQADMAAAGTSGVDQAAALTQNVQIIQQQTVQTQQAAAVPREPQAAVAQEPPQPVRIVMTTDSGHEPAPLGSSQNPIRIIQQGNQYTSLQQLSGEQLAQIMQVVQQQRAAQEGATNSSILFNPQTQTRIVYKVLHPSELHKSKQDSDKSILKGAISVMKPGGPRRYQKRKRNDDIDKLDGPDLSREEKKEKKKHRPSTRYGRVSRPPKHMVKDYKHIHVLDWDEDFDDSDGGSKDTDGVFHSATYSITLKENRYQDRATELENQDLLKRRKKDFSSESEGEEKSFSDSAEYVTYEVASPKPKRVKKSDRLRDSDEKKKTPEVQQSTTKFSDVGGNENTLKEVCKLLVHMRHPEVYEQLGITPPRGFLLHGPPGCGKTLLANAIAGELELPFLKIAATEIVSGVSGESEEKLRDIFSKALASAPCILFIDEIDAITQKRETASKDMERRIVSQLLTCMDDLNTKGSGHILVIGATNRPDSLDPALRRAGRFDREIALGIPDENARMRILEVLCRDLKLSPGFDFLHLARHTPGYVGADLMALGREAAMVAVNRAFKEIQQATCQNNHNPQQAATENTQAVTDVTQAAKQLRQTVAEVSQTVAEVSQTVAEVRQTVAEVSQAEVEVSQTVAEVRQAEVEVSQAGSQNSQTAIVGSQAGSQNSQTANMGSQAGSQNSQTAIVDIQAATDTCHTEISQSEQMETDQASLSLEEDGPSKDAAGQVVSSSITAAGITTNPSVNHTDTDSLASVMCWLKEQPPLSEDQLHDLFITMDDFQEALQHVQPSAKREGFATVPDVTWDDIGALQDIREELQMAILAPVRHPEHFKSLGLTTPPGILLAGPPGCGKTLLAKAVANESGINFISVKGPELLNMYVGESERAVRQVFQRARNSAPCVIFFDELDALCPRRSDSGEAGSGVRVVNQLLTEMDGLQERKQVFIMGATNRPDIIDPAVLRPGRLDKTLYVGLPSVKDREDILKTITKNGTKPKLAEDVSLQVIAKDSHCERFTGADLAALVREAAVTALREFMSGSQSGGINNIRVNSQHFQKSFKKVLPSVSVKDQSLYSRMKERIYDR